MSWVHKHKWKLVGQTYSPPSLHIECNDLVGMATSTQKVMERAASGWTTYLWQCEDQECGSIHKEICQGAPVNWGGSYREQP